MINQKQLFYKQNQCSSYHYDKLFWVKNKNPKAFIILLLENKEILYRKECN